MWVQFCNDESGGTLALSPLIEDGFVEYHDWSANNPYDMGRTQMSAYLDGAFCFVFVCLL